jgi:hypothetical protein
MGSSGIGDALKTGLTAYALQQSGAVDWLNSQGLSKNEKGKWDYKVPQGSVPPANATQQAVAPNISANSSAPVMPTFNAPPAEVTVTPIPDVGGKILDGEYHGAEHSFVDPQAQRDFNPYVPQTGYNTMLATGNEYKQMPGYGKLAKAMQGMAGGMAGGMMG